MRISRFVVACLWTGVFLGISAYAEDLPKLLKQAFGFYEAKQYAESAWAFERVSRLDESSARAGDEYNAARSYALAGNRSGALRMLRSAVKDGYLDAECMQTDRDLASVRADPGFRALLDHAREMNALEERRWKMKTLQTPYAVDLAMADKMAGLAMVWSEVRYNFANWWHVPDLDWDAAYRDATQRVQGTRTTVEYYRELQRLMARLHDGHSSVYFPSEYDKTLSRPALRTRLIDGHVIVTEVWDASLRERGVTPGVELLTINGEGVKPYAEMKVRPYESADTQQDLDVRTYTYHLLLAPLDTKWKLGLQGRDGRRWTETVGQAAEGESAAKPNFEMKMLPGGIVYVNLRSFGNDEVAKEFEGRFAEIRSAKGLVIDVRENGGGSGAVGGRILQTLIERPVLTSRWATRTYAPTSRAWGQAQGESLHTAEELTPNPKLHFGGRVAVLEGPMTFSAAEDFLVAYVNSGRGALIGEPSGGSTGQPLLFDLPGGGRARVCTKHDSFPDGREFVGVGVLPSIALHNTVEDVQAGRDAVLARAVLELSR